MPSLILKIGGQTSCQTVGQIENLIPRLSGLQIEILKLIESDLKISRKQISDRLEIKKLQFITSVH